MTLIIWSDLKPKWSIAIVQKKTTQWNRKEHRKLYILIGQLFSWNDLRFSTYKHTQQLVKLNRKFLKIAMTNIIHKSFETHLYKHLISYHFLCSECWMFSISESFSSSHINTSDNLNAETHLLPTQETATCKPKRIISNSKRSVRRHSNIVPELSLLRFDREIPQQHRQY